MRFHYAIGSFTYTDRSVLERWGQWIDSGNQAAWAQRYRELRAANNEALDEFFADLRTNHTNGSRDE